MYSTLPGAKQAYSASPSRKIRTDMFHVEQDDRKPKIDKKPLNVYKN